MSVAMIARPCLSASIAATGKPSLVDGMQRISASARTRWTPGRVEPTGGGDPIAEFVARDPCADLFHQRAVADHGEFPIEADQAAEDIDHEARVFLRIEAANKNEMPMAM